MFRTTIHRLAVLVSIFTLFSLPACADDTSSNTGETDDGTTSSTSTGAADSSTGGDVSTGDGDGSSSGGEEPETSSCDAQLSATPSFAVVVEPMREIIIDAELDDATASGTPFYCDQTGIVVDALDSNSGLARDQILQLVVYRPDAGNGAWPERELPLVIVTPGNGLEAFDAAITPGQVPSASQRYYDHVIEPLVRRGAVVVAAQGSGPSANEQVRSSLMACAVIWTGASAGWSEAGNSRLSRSLTIAGHSRGGGAVFLLTRLWQDFQSVVEMAAFDLCASIGIGPRWNDYTTDTLIVDGEVALPLGREVPFLVIAAAIDEDVRGQPVSMYDAIAPEDESDAAAPESLSPHDKAMVWTYALRHASFGGLPGGFVASNEEIGHAVAGTAVESFLVWQLGDADQGDFRAFFENLADPDATGTGVPVLDDPLLWTTNPDLASDEFYVAYGNRPPIYASLSEGVRPTAESPDGVPDRLVIDTMARRGAADELLSLGSGAGQSEGWLSPTGNDSLSNLASVTLEGLSPSNVWHGAADLATDDLNTTTQQEFDRHQTTLLRVDWDDTTPAAGGTILWTLPALDVSRHSFLSLRIGSVFEKSAAQDECSSANEASSSVDIELVFEDNGTQTVEPSEESGVVLTQPVEDALDTSLEFDCSATSAMHTVRVPLRRYCEQGDVNAERLVGVRLRFRPPGDGVVRRVLVDSVEITRDELDPSDAPCGQAQGAWACTPSQLLSIEEQACGDVPIAGVCPTVDQQTTTLSAPTYDLAGQSGTGWVVHTPRGWIQDLNTPTAAELESVRGLCARACEQEYVDESSLSANCDGVGSFATPTLLSPSSIGAEPRMQAEASTGAGLFGQAGPLDCDLNASCCFEFDEALCRAAPARVTAALDGLGEGTERVLKLQSGYTNVSLITPGATTTKNTKGTVSFSKTEDPDGDGYRPFFLGSFGVTRDQVWGHSDMCQDGSPLQLWIKNLSLQLVQPTFGVEEIATGSVGMPAGSLRMLATFEANGEMFTLEGWNEDEVYFEAQDFYFEANNVDVSFSIPCGDADLPIRVRFNVKYSQVLAIGPEVEEITTPTSVSCGQTVSLNADIEDLDADLVSTRWYVDDILLGAAVSSIQVEETISLRVVATDARGAVSSMEKVVSCF